MSLYPTVRTTIRMMPMVYWKKFDAVVPVAPYLCIRQSREKEDKTIFIGSRSGTHRRLGTHVDAANK